MTVAKPVSENFDSLVNTEKELPAVWGSFIFESTGTSSSYGWSHLDTRNAGDNYLHVYTDGFGGNDGTGISFRAQSGDAFSLKSLELVQASYSVKITGYLNGEQVAEDTVDAGIADSVGSITYTLDTSNYGGTLAFSSIWSRVDKVVFTMSDNLEGIDLSIDNIVLQPSSVALATASDSGIAGDNITNKVKPALEITATASTEYDVYIDGLLAEFTITTGSDGKYVFDTYTWLEGAHSFAIRINGTTEDTAKVAFTVDTTAKAPGGLALDQQYVLPNAAKDATTDVTPLISGTGEAGATVTVRVDGNVVGTTQVNGDKTWSLSTTQLGEGKHAVTAQQVDVAGNQSDVSASLAITVSLPGAPVLDPGSDTGTKGDKITSDTTPTLSGVARPDTKIFIMDGDYVVGETTTNKDGTWTVDADLENPYLYQGSSIEQLGVATLDSGYQLEGKHELRVAFEEPVEINYARGASSGVLVKGAALTLTINTKTVITPTPAPTTPPTTIDGVSVITKPVTTPGGGTGTSITVPVVTSGRTEQSGDAGTADIPLTEKNGAALLTAKVHTGYGLTANGGIAQGSASSLAELIAAIKQTGSTNGISDVTHLTNGGTSFLSLLPNDASLLVQTVRVTGSDTDGSGALDLVGNTDTRAAIVLDATQLAAGTHITLTDIPFAAVFGAVNVTATTAGQILTGDAQGQQFTVSTGAGSTVLSGGGADTLQFGIGASAGTSAANGLAAASTTLLHGGTEADVAVFKGAAADFTVEQHDGYVLVSSKATPEQVAKLVNVESLKFDDQTIAIESRVELNTLAGLYESVLGRQADVGGFDYWGGIEQAGNSLGTVAVAIISSVEGTARLGALNGDAAHDVEILYQAFFERASDAGGKAYWVGQMANGASLEDVADAMAHSVEIIGHQKAVTAWDFAV